MRMTLPLPRRLLALLFGVLGMVLFAAPASADCAAAPGSANLGTTGSFTAATTAQGAITGTGFTCSGSGVLTLITTNTVTATIQSGTNSNGTQPRLFNAVSGDHIPFTICRDSSCATTYPIGTQGTWSSTTLLGLLNLFSGPGGSLPLYMRTVPGTQVAAGTYTSTLTIAWTWDICSVGALGLCLVRDTGSTVSTIDVTMIITNDCAIAAPALDFGSAPLTDSFDPVTQAITIRCSKDAAYTVGIDDGLHASGGTRRLNGGSGTIAYDIFFPAGSGTRWGSAGAERRSSSQATTNAGTYTGSTGQTYTYRAQITPGQSTPPAGTYTDTLTVDVQF